MKSSNKYVINEETVCIEGKVDEQNQAYSSVVEKNQTLVIHMSPIEIIDNSLLYYCSSFKGANEGARSVLGNICMLPLVIYAPLDIYWFPSSSPYRPDCTWFSLKNIRSYESLEQKKTLVYMKNGHTISLAMKKDRFERKWQRATHLRYITEARIQKANSKNFELNVSINGVQQTDAFTRYNK